MGRHKHSASKATMDVFRVVAIFCIIGSATGLQCYECSYFKRMPEKFATYWKDDIVTPKCKQPHSDLLKTCPAGTPRCAFITSGWKGVTFLERFCAPPSGCVGSNLLQLAMMTYIDKYMKLVDNRCCSEDGCNDIGFSVK